MEKTIINKEKRQVSRNLKAIITVSIELDYEDMQESMAGESHDLGEEYSNRFKSGELESYIIFVKAYIPRLGIKGTDVLGACHVHSNSVDEDALEIATEHNMVEEALEELKKELIATNAQFESLKNEIKELESTPCHLNGSRWIFDQNGKI